MASADGQPKRPDSAEALEALSVSDPEQKAAQPFRLLEDDSEPGVGDSVYVVRHGPAVVVEVAPDRAEGSGKRGRKKFKVRYPDGTTYHVSKDDILASEPPAVSPEPSRAGQCTRSRLSPSEERLLASPTGPRRLEYLGRAFDDSSRNVSTPSAMFSLVATMVGGGVLSLPYAMSQCGLVFGTITLLISAAASTWTLDMLVDCARCTGRDTFELIGHAAFGEFGRKVTIMLVFVICWLALVAYSVLLADLLVPIVQLVFGEAALAGFSPEGLRQLTLIGATALLSPMCYKDGLHSLRFLCYASVGSVLFVGFVISMRAAETAGTPHDVFTVLPSRETTYVHIGSEYNLWPKDWIQALYVVPTFGVSFMCHFNALPTHQELQRPTRPRIRRVLSLTMGLTTCIYFVFGLAGYLYAGVCTCGNILLNFGQNDKLIAAARVALGLVLMLNFPLICQPCRNALYRVILGWNCVKAASANDLATPALSTANNAPEATGEAARTSERRSSSVDMARVHVYLREDTEGHIDRSATLQALDSFAPKDETVQQGAATPTMMQRCVLTTLILGCSLFLACFLRSVMVVWSILGSTVCFMVGFILPASFWSRIMAPFVSATRKNIATTLIVIITSLSISCTFLAILKLDAPPCPAVSVPAPGPRLIE
eukprot:TRINITY_DN36304_c0_g7_i1.p1 TRINITY_DN36304_c0_g7~~TRINITY_DN36304_c0_g7_i1.p1  ORF type:complete len:682 (-),score=90.11 TRINITY_DN36304_c0_g7_i1:143-2110(-)